MSAGDAPSPEAAPPLDQGVQLDEGARLEAARRRGFRPLMQLVERLRPDHPDVGTTALPHEEAIRFRHDPALCFSTGDVAAVRLVPAPPGPNGAAGGAPLIEITTTFLGLTGAVSPLPDFLAEEVADEVRHAREGEARRCDFLDLIHHRLLSLLHRGLALQDLAAGRRADGSDVWSAHLLALAGVDPAGRRPEAPAWRLLRWAPLLVEPAITGPALEAALADALGEALAGAGVAVEQLAGGFVPIGPEDRTRLGLGACTLGRTAVLGAEIPDRSERIRVVIGPLGREGYLAFRAAAPRALVREVVDALAPGLAQELVLWLAPEAAPPPALSSAGAFRVGENAWLGRQHQEVRLPVPAA